MLVHYLDALYLFYVEALLLNLVLVKQTDDPGPQRSSTACDLTVAITGLREIAACLAEEGSTRWRCARCWHPRPCDAGPPARAGTTAQGASGAASAEPRQRSCDRQRLRPAWPGAVVRTITDLPEIAYHAVHRPGALDDPRVARVLATIQAHLP